MTSGFKPISEATAFQAVEYSKLGYRQKQEEASTGDLGHFLSVQTDDYCGYKHTSFGLTKRERASQFRQGSSGQEVYFVRKCGPFCFAPAPAWILKRRPLPTTFLATS
jgi:hypothetical protein